MLRIVVALVLLGHGIGHSLGLLQSSRVITVNPTWQGNSWLLSGIVGPTATQLIGIVLWTVALIGFVALAGVVMGLVPATWFGPLAIAACVASLLGVVCFPVAFPTLSTAAALVVDVAVLTAVWLRWDPEMLTD